MIVEWWRFFFFIIFRVFKSSFVIYRLNFRKIKDIYLMIKLYLVLLKYLYTLVWNTSNNRKRCTLFFSLKVFKYEICVKKVWISQFLVKHKIFKRPFILNNVHNNIFSILIYWKRMLNFQGRNVNLKEIQSDMDCYHDSYSGDGTIDFYSGDGTIDSKHNEITCDS